jgi:hypothetical protein
VPGAELEDVPHWQGLAEFLLKKATAIRARASTVGTGVLAQDTKRPELAATKARILALAAEFARHEELSDLLHATRELPPREYRERRMAHPEVAAAGAAALRPRN